MRRMKSENGQSVIEFALVLPMLMVLCVGMAELGRALWAWNMAQMAASEGARRGIVISNGAWADSVQAGAHSILWGKDQQTEQMLSGVTVTPTINHSVTPNLLEVINGSRQSNCSRDIGCASFESVRGFLKPAFI